MSDLTKGDLMTTTNTTQYRFEEELKLIEDTLIREFTRKCLEKAPKYFWTIPSSSTGKHHPSDENCIGGCIIHVRKTVKIVEDLCREHDVSGIDRDCVISAAIMHDLCKSGYPNDLGYTVSGHGALWQQVANQAVKFYEFLNNKNYATIGRLIASHMGRFDIPYIDGGDVLLQILQTSDYIASRKYLSVNLETTNGCSE
jgi:23S rRNA maturation-related 3'-5' exoribonuclease YhaM